METRFPSLSVGALSSQRSQDGAAAGRWAISLCLPTRAQLLTFENKFKCLIN